HRRLRQRRTAAAAARRRPGPRRRPAPDLGARYALGRGPRGGRGGGVIVDCHTHVGDSSHFSGEFLSDTIRAWGPQANPARTLEEHWETVALVDKAIVLAFAAPRIGFEVPNDYVAGYVAEHPEKLVGFASVDANDPGAVKELERAIDSGLRGLKLAPTYQG